MIVCVLAILGYIFQDEIVTNYKKITSTNNSCANLEPLELALRDEISWPEYASTCKDFFKEISEEKFEVKITQLLKSRSQISSQLLLDAGKFYDPNFEQHLLKALKPEMASNVRLAIHYYNMAKAKNVSGAERLLRTACKNRDDPTIKELTKLECKGL
jgi:hypothetical protein